MPPLASAITPTTKSSVKRCRVGVHQDAAGLAVTRVGSVGVAAPEPSAPVQFGCGPTRTGGVLIGAAPPPPPPPPPPAGGGVVGGAPVERAAQPPRRARLL